MNSLLDSSGCRRLSRIALINNTRGSVGLMFALTIIPLVALAGGGVDYFGAYGERVRMQSAADSAVLAAVKDNVVPADVETFVENWIAANAASSDAVSDIDVSASGGEGSATVTVTANVKTNFLNLINIPNINIGVRSSAQGSSEPTELVLALDTTGSMAFNGNWPRAVDAIDSMLNNIQAAAGSENLYVTLMPFSDRVNVGTDKSSWLNVAAPWVNWQGCLEPREEVHPGLNFALSDIAPDTSGFNPSAQGYYGPIGAYRGGVPHCPEEIEGPTHDLDGIRTALNNITPTGTGRFDEAMAWAWRLISPSWQGEWDQSDASYPSEYGERRKVVVFMTDGHTIGYEYEVYENGNKRPWGRNNATPKGLRHMEHVCDQMKEGEIELHILYVTGNSNAIPYLRNCATSDDTYHEITDISALETALKSIRAHIVDARLLN